MYGVYHGLASRRQWRKLVLVYMLAFQLRPSRTSLLSILASQYDPSTTPDPKFIIRQESAENLEA